MSITINMEKCIRCKLCILDCPNMAINMNNPEQLEINEMFCEQEEGCVSCILACPVDAIENNDEGDI